jgi:hypothetical protein
MIEIIQWATLTLVAMMAAGTGAFVATTAYLAKRDPFELLRHEGPAGNTQIR